jgi:hypothetical protein
MQHISESIVSAVSLNESSIRFVMPVTGRGRVHALLVKQTAGSLDGFAVKLFSQSAACPPNYPEREEESETSDLSPDIFQVLETLTVAGAASFGAIRRFPGDALHQLRQCHARAGRRAVLRYHPQQPGSEQELGRADRVPGMRLTYDCRTDQIQSLAAC